MGFSNVSLDPAWTYAVRSHLQQALRIISSSAQETDSFTEWPFEPSDQVGLQKGAALLQRSVQSIGSRDIHFGCKAFL